MKESKFYSETYTQGRNKANEQIQKQTLERQVISLRNQCQDQGARQGNDQEAYTDINEMNLGQPS